LSRSLSPRTFPSYPPRQRWQLEANRGPILAPGWGRKRMIISQKDWDDIASGVFPYKMAMSFTSVQRHPDVLFSGNFNPITRNQRWIIRSAIDQTGEPVHLELCIKPCGRLLPYNEVEYRLRHIRKECDEIDGIGNVYITAEPHYVGKSRFFPNCTFVVGSDTFQDVCGYDDMSLAKAINLWEARFMVFQRDGFTTRVSPGILNGRYTLVPKSVYADDGHSSSKERE
jgi:hypothetical protein